MFGENEVIPASYIVYILAVAIGQLARGLTGSGHGIMAVAVWALVQVAGGPSGPLNHMLCLQCVATVPANIFMLIKTRAWERANKTIVLTICPAAVRKLANTTPSSLINLLISRLRRSCEKLHILLHNS
jgi:hypothetical protein